MNITGIAGIRLGAKSWRGFRSRTVINPNMKILAQSTEIVIENSLMIIVLNSSRL
jgi:hypothetical protein